MSNVEKKHSLPVQWAMSAKDHFLKIADEATWIREISFAQQIIDNNPEGFAKCNNESIKSAIVNIALTGATLNPAMKQAYLIPRSIKGKGLCCCLDFSYIGLTKIATDSGSVLDIDSTCVYEGDEFYYEMGLEPTMRHIPSGNRNDKELTHVYAVANLHGGLKKFLVMTKEEIDKARDTSTAKNSPAWRDWFGEMARKTVIKRFYKLLPQTDRLSEAIHVVNEFEGIATPVKENLKDRFVKPLESGETLPTLLEKIDALESTEELEKFWKEHKEEIENSPEKDKLIEAIDYQKSILKEKES